MPERPGPITNHLQREERGGEFKPRAAGQRPDAPRRSEPVRRPPFLPCKLEQVVPEEQRHLVVLQQLPPLGVLAVAAVEYVERAVVFGGLQVFHVVLHLHLHGVAVVVLPTFELLVSVFAFEALQSPFLASGPALLTVQEDDGFVGPLEARDELLWGKAEGIHPLHVVLEQEGNKNLF